MRRLLRFALVAVLAAGSVGCNWCGRRPLFGWWNNGDSCQTCNGAVDPYSGSLGTPILNSVPSGPRDSNILPAPVSIGPIAN